MRIAVVTEVFLPAVDGVVTRLRRTLEELARAGDELLVVAPAGGPPSYAGAKVVPAPPLRLPLYPDGSGYPEKRVSLPGRTAGDALTQFGPDVVHAVNPFLLAAGAVGYARRHRVPLVASFHANVPAYARYYGLGMLEGLGWRYVRALHNAADLNLCTSSATMRTLAARGIERLALWPYGVDSAPPRGSSARWESRSRLSGGHPERTILLFVGRLAKEKSIERLVPVAREPGIAVAIVGDGPVRGKLEREFAGTPTTFAGLLTGADLASAYAAADVFVFPSETETLGMVMLEAHAAGLPVIAANSPAAREVVRDGVDGLRYDPADPRSLQTAVSRLVDDHRLRAMMAIESRRAVADATWEAATAVLRQHYEWVLRPQARGHRVHRPARPELDLGPAQVVAEHGQSQ